MLIYVSKIGGPRSDLIFIPNKHQADMMLRQDLKKDILMYF